MPKLRCGAREGEIFHDVPRAELVRVKFFMMYLAELVRVKFFMMYLAELVRVKFFMMYLAELMGVKYFMMYLALLEGEIIPDGQYFHYTVKFLLPQNRPCDY